MKRDQIKYLIGIIVLNLVNLLEIVSAPCRDHNPIISGSFINPQFMISD